MNSANDGERRVPALALRAFVSDELGKLKEVRKVRSLAAQGAKSMKGEKATLQGVKSAEPSGSR